MTRSKYVIKLKEFCIFRNDNIRYVTVIDFSSCKLGIAQSSKNDESNRKHRNSEASYLYKASKPTSNESKRETSPWTFKPN